MRPALGRSLYEGLDLLGADEPCECFDVGAGGWLQIDGVGARVHPSLGGGGDLVGGAVGGGVGRGIQAPVLDFVDGVLSRVGGGGAQQVGDDGVGLGLGRDVRGLRECVLSAARSASGVVRPVMTVPVVNSPLSRSVRGPVAAARSSMLGRGESRVTSSRLTKRPREVTLSPCSNAVRHVRYRAAMSLVSRLFRRSAPSSPGHRGLRRCGRGREMSVPVSRSPLRAMSRYAWVRKHSYTDGEAGAV